MNRSLFRLTLVWLTIIGVAAGCFMLVNSRQQSSVSDHETGLTVAVSWSMAGRTISATDASGERVEQPVIQEWGPELRTNIYHTPSGGLAVVDFAGAWVVLRDPLRLESVAASNDWEYRGTLLERGFRPAEQEAECMDILMDEPPPAQKLRGWAYRTQC